MLVPCFPMLFIVFSFVLTFWNDFNAFHCFSMLFNAFPILSMLSNAFSMLFVDFSMLFNAFSMLFNAFHCFSKLFAMVLKFVIRFTQVF